MASKKRKGKRFFRLLLFITLIVIAFMTNPDKSTHIEKINDKLFDLLPNNEKTSIIKSIGRVVSDQVLDRVISVNNYLVFSVSKIEIMGKSETIGYGVFGMVIFTDKIRDVDL